MLEEAAAGPPALGRGPALRALLRRSAYLLAGNRRLRRVAETWGLWVVGDSALLVLFSVTAYDRGGTAAVAVIGALRMVPGALAGPLLSLIADRTPRARVVVAVLATWVAFTAAVPAALRVDSPLPMYLLVGVASVTGTLLRPAVSALIPQVIDRPDELTVANSTYSVVEAAGTLVGPLLAGALVAGVATTARYETVALVLALAAVIGLTIRTEFKPARRRGTAGLRRLFEPLAGFPALVTHPRLRSVYVVFMAQTTTRGVLNVLLVAFAVSLPGDGLASTGVFFAALGAGGVIGGVLTIAGTGWRPATPFVLGMSLWGVPLIAMATHPAPWIAWLVLAAVGVGNALGDVYGFTLMHRFVPDHLLGRLFGAFWGTAAATQALGAAVAVPLVEHAGLNRSFLVVGVAMTAIALLSWSSVRQVSADLQVDEHDVDVLRRCSLLAPLTRVALEQLARRASVIDVPADRMVIEEGEAGETFFVVDSGLLDALVDGVPMRTLGPGDCFGEIAALHRTPRTATVSARTPCRLLRLEGADFVLAVTGHRFAEQVAHSTARERITSGSSSRAGDAPAADDARQHPTRRGPR